MGSIWPFLYKSPTKNIGIFEAILCGSDTKDVVMENEKRFLIFCFITIFFIIDIVIILRERDTKDIDKETNSGQGGDKETGEKPLEQVEARVWCSEPISTIFKHFS